MNYFYGYLIIGFLFTLWARLDNKRPVEFWILLTCFSLWPIIILGTIWKKKI